MIKALQPFFTCIANVIHIKKSWGFDHAVAASLFNLLDPALGILPTQEEDYLIPNTNKIQLEPCQFP